MAQRGGNIAGVAREQAEKELGGSVVSPENFLSDSDKQDDTGKSTQSSPLNSQQFDPC